MTTTDRILEPTDAATADAPVPVAVGGPRTEALDPEDREAVDSWLRLLEAHAATTEHAAPVCRTDQEGALVFAPPSTRLETWVVRDGATTLGSLRLAFVEGRSEARVDELVTHPDHRRRGVGRLLLARAVERARADGRTALVVMVAAPLEGGCSPGQRFAGAVGAQVEARPGGLRQVLDVSDRHQAPPHPMVPQGTQLVRWGTVTPEQWAATASLLETTLGRSTAGKEGDASYARRFEQVRVGRGRRAHHTGVVDVSTGALVGYTSISMTATQPGHALQGMTVVQQSHRGRRLGLVLKEANLAHVLSVEPGLRVVETTNDEDNAAMLAVNVELGFVPVERLEHWRLDL